jgi:hypothetical protein
MDSNIFFENKDIEANILEKTKAIGQVFIINVDKINLFNYIGPI